MDQIDTFFIDALTRYVWPFGAVSITLAVIGKIIDRRIFTRHNARRNFGTDTRSKLLHAWFYWGRETLPLHPIATSACISFVWKDPEGKGWGTPETVMYWIFCGVVSLFIWAIAKGYAKHKGISLEMLGDSDRPPVPHFTPYTIETLPPGDVIEDNGPRSEVAVEEDHKATLD